MIQAPKGTHDIYGEEMRLWRRVEDEIRTLADVYGYGEIRTPLFESTDLYLRGVGDTTDIVQKEMYTFEDKGGRSMSLRPELTAGVARAYIERGMFNQPQPTKLFYIGPCFRYEKPQAGRYRQHYQFGVEIFGASSPAAEAEVISLGHTLLTRLGIEGVRLHINSIGCADCRVSFNEKLRTFLKTRLENLCSLCASRCEKNPLRVLDCKSPHCQAQIKEAPVTTEALCGECDTHFTTLRDLLTRFGIPYIIDGKIVRGLDYYTRTVFEFIRNDACNDASAQQAEITQQATTAQQAAPAQTVIGGGRYDGLIFQLGGAPTGAVGFGMGMERLVSLLRQDVTSAQFVPKLFIGHADEAGFTAANGITADLRQAGIYAVNDLADRSVKAQMKYAGKINARYTTILGATELTQNTCTVKDMETGQQQTIPLDGLRNFLK
ncbi:MAG: histidine--tRNA ligase [Defluviitaleaceae bacterium]|nr:histidine--tRNA ligase [Defluviitaleaceae bacterium]